MNLKEKQLNYFIKVNGPSDNRGAGSSIIAALSHLSDGVQVKFKII